MKLWPSDSFEIESPLSVDEAVAALTAEIDRTPWHHVLARWKKARRSYRGTVSREGFKVHPGPTDLFVICGRFLPGPAGVRVAVTVRLHRFFTVASAVPFILFAYFMYFFGASGRLGKLPLSLIIGEPAWLFALFLVWSIAFFWLCRRFEKPRLVKMFEATTN